MKALALIKTGRIENQIFKIIDVDEPRIKSNEVLVRINEVGFCKMDIDLIEGNYLQLGYPPKTPLILGHEILGKIEDTGDEVKLFKKFDNVAIGAIYNACLMCKNCLQGKENLCENLEVTGISCNGGITRYIKIKENFIFKVPEELNSKVTAIICNGGFAYRCLKHILEKNAEKIGLFGNDVTACILAQMLRYYGIETHLIVGRGETINESKYYDNILQVKDLKSNVFDLTVAFYHNPELIEKSFISLKKGGLMITLTLGITRLPTVFESKSIVNVGLPNRLDIKNTIEFLKKRNIEIEKEEIEINNILEGLRKIKTRNLDKKLFLNVQKHSF